jgi:hypothetical protein
MAFMVVASRAISSRPGGIGTRRSRAAEEMASTSRRMPSTGASARPTTSQVTAAATTSRIGRPTISSSVTTDVDSLTDSRVRAAMTV